MDENNQEHRPPEDEIPPDSERPLEETPSQGPQPPEPTHISAGSGEPMPGELLPPHVPPPSNTDSLILWGWIFAALSLVCCCCPLVFAVPAIILGAIAYSRGDQRGLWVIIAGVVALILGGALGFTARTQRWFPGTDRIPGGPWRWV